tara:strand:+ start:159 stop:476 length:318 start_codon:yes stop_codon:yes gene_type:complete
MNKVEKASELSFRFALRNGSELLSFNGESIPALLIESPTLSGNRSIYGRNKASKVATVGVLKSDLKSRPQPGDRVKLGDWEAQITSDGILDVPGGYQFELESARS